MYPVTTLYFNHHKIPFSQLCWLKGSIRKAETKRQKELKAWGYTGSSGQLGLHGEGILIPTSTHMHKSPNEAFEVLLPFNFKK